MDINLIQKFVSICARRGAGKSELCRYLYLTQKSQFDSVFVISPTDFSGFWSQMVGSDRVKTHYDEEWVDSLLKRMAAVNKGKSKKATDFKNVMLVLDDVFAEVRGHQLKSLTKLCQAGRHYGITILAVSQFFTNISPSQRQNSDYIFYGKCNRASKELLEHEFNLGMDSKEFLSMVERATEDHGFLVIDNAASSIGNLNFVYGRVKVPSKFIKRG